MKMNYFLLAFLLLSSIIGYSQTSAVIDSGADSVCSCETKDWKDSLAYEEVSYRFKIEKIKSEFFPDEERVVKIFLPDNYSHDSKYPVIYVLDGYFLFDVTTAYVRQLIKGAAEGYEIMPSAIVVGIFHNNRGYETNPNFESTEYYEGSAKLKKFIEHELIPHIDSSYGTSGFNIVIGHSNTGHFAINLLNQETNPFNGIIAMSVSMNKNKASEDLTTKITAHTDEIIFIGYGSRDDDFNEFAEGLIRHEIKNINLRVAGFNAGHLELPAIALVGGLEFMFGKYKNFDDFPIKAADYNFSIEKYESDYVNAIHNLYGVDIKLTPDDYFHLVMNCVKSKNTGAFYKITNHIEENKIDELGYHTYFYLTHDLGDWEAARKYAYKMVESDDENDKLVLVANIATYNDFFVNDLKNPSEAINFLEKAIISAPEHKLEYSYFIVKTSIEHNMAGSSKAKKYLKYCKQNFRDNRFFSNADIDALSHR